jgi:hypothetical protein
MDSQRFNGIFRARGMVSAGLGKHGRNDPLINLYGNCKQENKQNPDPSNNEEIIHLFPNRLNPTHAHQELAQK